MCVFDRDFSFNLCFIKSQRWSTAWIIWDLWLLLGNISSLLFSFNFWIAIFTSWINSSILWHKLVNNLCLTFSVFCCIYLTWLSAYSVIIKFHFLSIIHSFEWFLWLFCQFLVFCENNIIFLFFIIFEFLIDTCVGRLRITGLGILQILTKVSTMASFISKLMFWKLICFRTQSSHAVVIIGSCINLNLWFYIRMLSVRIKWILIFACLG